MFLFFGEVHAEIAIEADYGIFARLPQSLRPCLRQRPGAVELDLAPSGRVFALSLQLDDGHVVVQAKTV